MSGTYDNDRIQWHRGAAPPSPYCQAGRDATFGGRWRLPCFEIGNHALAFSQEVGSTRVNDTPILQFCDRHMAELIAAGIIDEVAVPMDEWSQRAGGSPP